MKDENNYFLFRYSRRLEKQKGYETPKEENITANRYIGTADRLYGRFRSSHRNDFSLGLTFEKDAGEPFSLNKNQKGFDFYSSHLLLENKLGFSKILIGDFQMQIGQGLVFGGGFAPGKGVETINIVKRNTRGILPYTSSLEQNFFRGVALTKSINKFHFSFMASRLLQDGSLTNGQVIQAEGVNSILQTGFHRTQNELSNKNNIAENSIGGRFQYTPSLNLTMGINTLQTFFEHSISPPLTPANQFIFRGNKNTVGSFYLNYNWKNFVFFGEGGISSSLGVGILGGYIASISKSIDISFLARHYDRNFHSFYSNSFSERTNASNEQGIYWGMAFKPSKSHVFKLYFDYFRFPWLQYQVDAPLQGYEWLGSYTFKPRREMILQLRFREQLREVSITEENLSVLKDQLRKNYQIKIEHKVNDFLTLRARIQGSTQIEAGNYSSGLAYLQDVRLDLKKVRIIMRMALFDTDNFDNAQYIYENDLLYTFSIPAHSGKGTRNFILLRYDPLKKATFWIKYALFNYRDRNEVGSGLDQAKGSISSEIRAMIRLKI